MYQVSLGFWHWQQTLNFNIWLSESSLKPWDSSFGYGLAYLSEPCSPFLCIMQNISWDGTLEGHGQLKLFFGKLWVEKSNAFPFYLKTNNLKAPFKGSYSFCSYRKMLSLACGPSAGVGLDPKWPKRLEGWKPALKSLVFFAGEQQFDLH